MFVKLDKIWVSRVWQLRKKPLKDYLFISIKCVIDIFPLNKVASTQTRKCPEIAVSYVLLNINLID